MKSGAVIAMRPNAAGGCASVFGILFFGAFLLAGLFFEVLVAREFLQTLQSYGWTATACRIESSRVRDTDDQGRAAQDYSFDVEYTYEFGGKSFTSRQYSRKNTLFSDYGEVQRLALRHPPGTKTVCYVNPAAPEQAVLQRDSLWFGFVLLFPLIFVAVGGGGVYAMVRSLVKRGKDSATSTPSTPLSEKASRTSRAVPVLVLGLFLVVGLAVLYALSFRALLKILDARNWLPTPCAIISSQVRSHSTDDGTTYGVNILYSYEIGGREYRSNRHHFMGGSSSGYDGKARVVRRYPPGTRTVCYVNPRDPTDAVLERGWTSDLLWGLIPLLFVAIGGGGLIALWRSSKRNQSTLPRSLAAGGRAVPARSGKPAPAIVPSADASSRVLKPTSSPLGKLLGAIFVAAFWNGIVSVFVWQAVQSWLRHRPEWFLTIFIIPFVVIGLVMIGAVFYTFMGLFNPRPTLVLTPGAVTPGARFEVRWVVAGRTHVLQRLRICLEGREEAQCQRGTTTVTDKSVFATIELANTADRLAMQSGEARVTIPAGLMHSWTAPHNKIIWAIQVNGEIPHWPDIKDEFPVEVLPRPVIPVMPK